MDRTGSLDQGMGVFMIFLINERQSVQNHAEDADWMGDLYNTLDGGMNG
jgi:hypothetical protein